MTRRALMLLVACAAATCGAGTARAADPGSYDVLRRAAPNGSATATVAARRAFRAKTGRFALLLLDASTGTPRALGRLDGFLTGRNAAAPRDIALGYVRARPELFGLDGDDLAALELVRHYSAGGIEQLRWAQTYAGVPAIDTSLTANLTREGRLINVLGSPRPDLAVSSVEPGVGAAAAYASAARTLGGRTSRPTDRSEGPERTTEFADGGTATLVIYEAPAGPRLGWRLLVRVDELHVYDAVVDATTGALVRHQNLVADASATVFKNHPGAASGGTADPVTLDAYLDVGATTLNGPTAHTFSDTGDTVHGPGFTVPTTTASNGEIGQSGGGDWTYALTPFGSCTPPCVWNPSHPSGANSWQTNRRADATQLHWFVGNFHDHLEDTPAIAFTNAAGNFEGLDRVIAQNMDGAALASGFPDDDHVNNANMTTYPEGTSPHMQMYLTESFFPTTGRSTAFDASVVYHEYTHGLVGRTIVDAGGFQAIGGAQGGAINEGTADWYAMDYLVGAALETDGAGADVMAGKYSFGQLRSEPMDCAVAPASGCGGGVSTGAGGYTYGDFGKVFGVPEVHADGEIFAQTMWQLRTELVAAHGAATGVDHARRLYTNGMRLAPDNPSFLDLRNAILQADTAAGLGESEVIWDVFAERGMGYFASTRDTGDTAPVESFALPPAPGDPSGTVTGTVTDSATSDPAAGLKVAFAGHDSGVGPELSATTDGSGVYTIASVPAGTYPLLRVRGGGYEEKDATGVVVGVGTNTLDFQIRRNLASAAGGATIASFTGADNTVFGCGPGGLIDGSQGVVWGSSSPGNPGDPGQKEIVVELPFTSDVGTIEIDPGAGCGDDDSASLGGYEVRVSTDGTTFTKVSEGAFTGVDNHRYNSISLSGVPSAVRFVKLIAKSPQGSGGSGASFMDVAEIRVFAGAAPPPDATTQAATGIGESVATLNGLVDPNGTLTDYQFEYGLTTAYGSKAPLVPASAGSGSVPVPVQASLSGLQGGRTYHYRLVAIRGALRVEGLDQTFATGPDTTRPVVGLTVPLQRLWALRKLGLKVKVAASEPGTARLQLVISATTARRLKLGRTRVIGSLTKGVAAGATTVTVKLTAKAKSALRTRKSVAFTLKATLTDPAQLKGTKSRSLTIRR